MSPEPIRDLLDNSLALAPVEELCARPAGHSCHRASRPIAKHNAHDGSAGLEVGARCHFDGATAWCGVCFAKFAELAQHFEHATLARVDVVGETHFAL